MTANKGQQLQTILADINQRWGQKTIRRLGQMPGAISAIPTGFPALDQALGVGGLPRGRISEIVGIPTSGMATLALKVAAQAQNGGGVVVYMDVGHTFDPAYAHRCGVLLAQLYLVQPADVPQALAMLPDFLQSGGMDLFVLDLPLLLQTRPGITEQLAGSLGRVLAVLAHNNCTLLCLTTLPSPGDPTLAAYPPEAALPHYATIRLLIQKARWLYRRRDVAGYEAQVLVVKNKLAPAGKQIPIAITFNGVVDGDGA